MAEQLLESRVKSLENDIRGIQSRNASVEIDKEWEVSPVRKFIITILTYLVIVAYMYSAGIASPWLNSIVPALAFMLSTLTLPFIKKIWVSKKQNKN
jgi:hypothetical protein